MGGWLFIRPEAYERGLRCQGITQWGRLLSTGIWWLMNCRAYLFLHRCDGVIFFWDQTAGINTGSRENG